jgi:hypothetical protein
LICIKPAAAREDTLASHFTVDERIAMRRPSSAIYILTTVGIAFSWITGSAIALSSSFDLLNSSSKFPLVLIVSFCSGLFFLLSARAIDIWTLLRNSKNPRLNRKLDQPLASDEFEEPVTYLSRESGEQMPKKA